jgi:hypothetical protein
VPWYNIISWYYYYDGAGIDSSTGGYEVVAVHPLCWPPWWWVEGDGLGFVVLAQRASRRSCSPVAIGSASPPSRWTYRMKGICSPLPQLLCLSVPLQHWPKRCYPWRRRSSRSELHRFPGGGWVEDMIALWFSHRVLFVNLQDFVCIFLSEPLCIVCTDGMNGSIWSGAFARSPFEKKDIVLY